MTESGYLARLAGRRHARELERQVVFGLAIGWIAVLVGGFRWAFVPGAAGLDAGFVWLGLGVLACAVAVPAALAVPERLARRASNFIARPIFLFLLLVIYAAVIVPIGALRRRRAGTAPFYWWRGEAPEDVEGWSPKEPHDEATASSGRGRPFFVQPFLVIAYLARQRRFFLLPAACLCLVLGLVLFFVHSSALAPFLYALF